MPSKLLVRLYSFGNPLLRKLIVKAAIGLEGGEIGSSTLREIFRKYFEVDIGMYTYGACFIPNAFSKNTTVGRYTSIARTAYAATRNHPMDYKSTHPFFFNAALGECEVDLEHKPLRIGNDVWLGHNSVVLPSVREIGDGAVVGAGAIVTKDVPPYAVVVGNPGRITRYRFPQEVIERLLAERWWDRSFEDIKKKNFEDFTRPYGK